MCKLSRYLAVGAVEVDFFFAIFFWVGFVLETLPPQKENPSKSAKKAK